MSELKLKNCPFCGEKPVIKKAGRTGYWWAGCEIHIDPETKGCGVSHSSYQKEDAIIKWNTRHDSCAELVEALNKIANHKIGELHDSFSDMQYIAKQALSNHMKGGNCE